MNGFISLHRKLLENPIFYKPALLQLFIYCLLKANHKANEFIFNNEMVKIQRGSFITGRKILSSDLRCKEATLYRRLQILKDFDYISIKTTNKYSVISVVNYNKYQTTVSRLKQENERKSNNKKDLKNIDNIEVTEKELIKSNNKITTNEQQNNTNNNDNNINKYYRNFVVLLYCKILNVIPDSSHYSFISKILKQDRDNLTYLQRCLLLCYVLKRLEAGAENPKFKGMIFNEYKETSYSTIKSNINKPEQTFIYKHNPLPY
jgi:hypothetical protein